MVTVDLVRADLSRARLIGVDLNDADLIESNLNRANLGKANLTGADLLGANLSGANLSGATMSRAIVGYTIFGSVDLSGVAGLETVGHVGPSTVGIDTILGSGGKIPDVFLRGCGVDPLIQKMLVGDGHSKSEAFYEWNSKGHNPLQRCFISYATEDKSFVDRLQKKLNERKVDYWYAPEHGRVGVDIKREIDLEISLRDRMLLVCSEVSLTKDYVQYEIERGIEQEKKRKAQVIFPVMIDDALLEWKDPHATHIRKVRAVDFRKATKGQAFEKKLPGLLQQLGYPG